MNALPVNDLLAPLSGDAPCGPDLEYDPAFKVADEASQGKPEQQFGDNIIPAKDPDWLVVYTQAREMANRSRDIRIAVWLARAGGRLHGVAAFTEGVALVAGLLEQHWDRVYPMLDADDNNDPTMRLNALAPLVDSGAGLADLRASTVGGGRQGLTVRQLELATGKVEPLPGESAPTLDGALEALRAAEAQKSGLLASLKQLHTEVVRVETLLIDKVGGAEGPELKPLRSLAQALASLATQAEGGAAMEGEDGAGQAGGGSASSAPGTLRSREDVTRLLDRACEWIERNEPANPAPLLIRRAQRLMGKNFLDIIRDLAPNGLDQVENIAGRVE